MAGVQRQSGEDWETSVIVISSDDEDVEDDVRASVLSHLDSDSDNVPNYIDINNSNDINTNVEYQYIEKFPLNQERSSPEVIELDEAVNDSENDMRDNVSCDLVSDSDNGPNGNDMDTNAEYQNFENFPLNLDSENDMRDNVSCDLVSDSDNGPNGNDMDTNAEYQDFEKFPLNLERLSPELIILPTPANAAVAAPLRFNIEPEKEKEKMPQLNEEVSDSENDMNAFVLCDVDSDSDNLPNGNDIDSNAEYQDIETFSLNQDEDDIVNITDSDSCDSSMWTARRDAEIQCHKKRVTGSMDNMTKFCLIHDLAVYATVDQLVGPSIKCCKELENPFCDSKVEWDVRELLDKERKSDKSKAIDYETLINRIYSMGTFEAQLSSCGKRAEDECKQLMRNFLPLVVGDGELEAFLLPHEHYPDLWNNRGFDVGLRRPKNASTLRPGKMTSIYGDVCLLPASEDRFFSTFTNRRRPTTDGSILPVGTYAMLGPIQLVNHDSQDPNAEYLEDGGRIVLNIIKAIKPEEEIVINYGDKFERFVEDFKEDCMSSYIDGNF